MRKCLFALLLTLSVPAFAAPDYVREQKWADEITPGIVIGDPVYLAQKNQHQFLALYTETQDARMALIVAHGMGIHPDWGMVGVLRSQLAEQGYTTLSIQMPVLAADAKVKDYKPTYAEAVERLQLAVDYLKAKGYSRIALVSHSLGSRMSYDFMVNNPPDVVAWAALGMVDVQSYASIKAPVLDLYGEKDIPAVLSGKKKRGVSLKAKLGSRQMMIAGTDHFFANREDAMVKAVKDFLDGVQSR